MLWCVDIIFSQDNIIYDTLPYDVSNPFKHAVLYNKSCEKSRDILLVIHGASDFTNYTGILEYNNLKDFINNRENIENYKDFVILFMTTEGKDSNGNHCLYDEEYVIGDYSYLTVGGVQVNRFIEFLGNNYNYDKSINKIISCGYSDGAWMSTMLGYMGLVDRVVAFAGLSFSNFNEWKHNIPDSGKKDKEYDIYISANDEYYTDKSGYYSRSPLPGSMQHGLDSIIAYFGCKKMYVLVVEVGKFQFTKSVYKNQKKNIIFNIYLDNNRESTHTSMYTSDTYKIGINNMVLKLLGKSVIQEIVVCD